MRILVTGNMGYIGPAVVERLRKSYKSCTIVGVDLGLFGHCLTDADILPECNVDIQYFMDVRDISDELLMGIDAIVHLAAISNDPIGNKFERITNEINYKASVELAKKAKKCGVKSFTFASSCSVYGAADDKPRTEDSSLNPLTAYAKSKVLTEEALEDMAGEGFKVTACRFATACGMSKRLRLDLVLNDFVAGALTSNKITILSDGSPWRPLINTIDMARAIDWTIIRKTEGIGDFLSVNIGSNEWNYQVKQLAEAVSEVISGVEVSINKNAEPDKRSYKVSFDKFSKLAPAEYLPQISLIETIKGLYEGLKNMNFNDSNFRESKLIRLKVIETLMKKNLLTSEFGVEL